MKKTIRLDLHTHPIEALTAEMGIKGILEIKKDVVSAIVQGIKSAGLQGIAITEQNNFSRSWVASLEIREHFQKENLFIFPGSETVENGQSYLQVYVPDYCRRRIPFFKDKNWFIVLAHPGYYQPLNGSHSSVHIDAIEKKSLHGEFVEAARLGLEMHIPLIEASGARTIGDIGKLYTEFELN